MSIIVLRNALLFDGRSDDLRDGVDIVVEDNRVREIVDGRASVGNAIEIDVKGRTVLPGLIDAHVHVFAVHLNAYRTKDYPLTYLTVLALPRIKAMLDRGFTTVRDVAGGDFGIKDALARNLIPGPRAFVGGPGLTQTGGHGDHRSRTDSSDDLCGCANGLDFTRRLVDGPDQMRLAVRDELRKGADHIKVMASGGVGSPHDAIDDCQFSEEELRIAAEETALRGTYVAAHTYGSKAVQRAVGNGIRTVEHCNLIDEETAIFVRDHNAFVVPTMVCYEVTERHGDDMGLSPVVMEKLRYVIEGGLRMLEYCARSGTKMGFGSDLMGEMEFAQAHEFVIRAQVQKPIDVLRSATAINGEILNRTGELGCVAPGALADMVVVDGNPLDDIALLDGQGENLSVIMQDGRLYKNRLPAREVSTATSAPASAAQ